MSLLIHLILIEMKWYFETIVLLIISRYLLIPLLILYFAYELEQAVFKILFLHTIEIIAVIHHLRLERFGN